MDFVYLALTLGFFALSWGLVKLLERLQEARVEAFYLVGGVIALVLLVYLFVALLKPEIF